MQFKLTRSQQHAFDDLKMPYTYDLDLGAVVGACKEGVGHGKWYWAKDDSTGRMIVMKRKKPYPYKKIKKQKKASVKQNMQRIAETMQNEQTVEKERKKQVESVSQTRVYPSAPSEQSGQSGSSGSSAKRPLANTEQERLMQQCTIVCTIRPCDGKNQYKVITPDNKTFRSKCSAAKHMLMHMNAQR